jgi:hypothetical protein
VSFVKIDRKLVCFEPLIHTNAYTAISFLHTHFPKGFPDMNSNSVSEGEIISVISKLK